VIVERFIAGNEHRLLVVGKRLVAAAAGEALWVTGDGKSNIIELVDSQINTDPRRGTTEDAPLNAIAPQHGAEIILELQRQGMTAYSIPLDGQKVLIQPNGNVATDVTDKVHPQVAAMATLAARVVGLDIAGIDVVAADISRPLEEQGGAIIEVNASPGLLAHIKPAAGEPRNVGEAIVDHLFAPDEGGRMPIVGITGKHGATMASRLIAWLLQISGKKVGLSCADGLFVNGRLLPRDATVGGNWIDYWARATTSIYKYWYDQFRTQMGFDPLARMENASLNIDSGNWCMKTFSTESDPYRQLQDMMRGFFVPGDLAMDVYYPHTPPLGQICPGTPIVFVTNFNLCTVTMYQFNPAGYLINYGVPFGREGIGGEGTLKAPQGIAVNSAGEIYIADSLNNRISMWQIQPTGYVEFRKNFRWRDDDGFTPCDIAIDGQDRLFVCDQFNNCLRVFDREGNSLWSYGHLGYCDDVNVDYENFMLPASVCIDGDRLIVNDLVNRALKMFRIGDDTLYYESGISVFKKYPDAGGVWMPYFIYADRGRLYVPDTTFNVVNVFSYQAAAPDSIGIAA